MDGTRFDHLTATLSEDASRRDTLRRLATAALGLGGLALLGQDESAAKKRRKKKGKKGGRKRREARATTDLDPGGDPPLDPNGPPPAGPGGAADLCPARVCCACFASGEPTACFYTLSAEACVRQCDALGFSDSSSVTPNPGFSSRCGAEGYCELVTCST